MPQCPAVANRLLRALPGAELSALLPHLTKCELRVRSFVVQSDRPVEYMSFVEAGTVSMISTLEDGAQIEVGMIGPEGVVGMAAFLGAPTSPVDGMVQVEGSTLQLRAAAVPAALAAAPTLSMLLLRYMDSFHVQVTQSAACNSHHEINHRLARWILMTHDRAEADSFIMTHEFMSIMLGVQRSGVTLAVGALRRAGLVSHEKGIVRILDRDGLEDAACECYGVVRERFAWLQHQT